MTFLIEPDVTPEVQAMYDGDQASYGFVMDLMHLWAHQPDLNERFGGLLAAVAAAGGFSFRDRGILVSATASTIGDSYCSIAWGWKLGAAADPALAASVLAGADEGLTQREQAMATWARKVAGGADSTTDADVQALRDAGWEDAQIFAITAFVGLRMAFSTINASLGAQPDAELAELASPEVLDVVTWGRPVGAGG